MLSAPLTVLLKEVSRSFYLSLRAMPAPARPTVSLAYLLCRAADTIADLELVPAAERVETLAAFRRTFQSFPSDKESLAGLAARLAEIAAGNTTGEGRLLKSLHSIFREFLGLSRTDQALVQAVVLGVIEGMTADLEKFGTETAGIRSLASRQELEAYIGFVGGEPGRFWTSVCLEHLAELRILERQRWIADGVEFGKGLQLVNILRDLPEDLRRGRCYLPEDLLRQVGLAPADLSDEATGERFSLLYGDLLDQTAERLRFGLRVIEAIPRRALRARLAVWWPLAIGMRTLEEMKRNPAPLRTKVKISRRQVYAILAASLFLAPSNGWLRRSFRQALDDLS